jgi:hypothetical protein
MIAMRQLDLRRNRVEKPALPGPLVHLYESCMGDAVKNEILDALSQSTKKPLNRLPRDLQSVVRKYIPLWPSMNPSERATKVAEVDKQQSVKSRIKMSRAVKASELAQDSPEYDRWLEIYRSISAKQREIKEWELLPETIPSEKEKKQAMLSRLGIELAELNSQITKPAQTLAPVVTNGDGTAPLSTAPAQTTTPASGVAAIDDPAKRSRKPSWSTVAMPYMKSVFNDGKYKSSAVFYKALLSRAGTPGSPFTKLKGELYCTEACTTVAEGTVGTKWKEIRAG